MVAMVAVPVAQVPDSEKLPPRVNFAKRQCNDVYFGIFYALVLLVQIILCFVILGNGGFDDFLKRFCECSNYTGTACVETNLLGMTGTGLGRLISKFPGYFVLAIVFSFFIGLAWIFLLQKFARIIVWCTLLLKVVGSVALGVYLLTIDDGATPGILLFCVAGVTLFVMFYMKDKIELAAEILRQAANALAQRPGMLGTATSLQIFLVLYMFLNNFALMNSWFTGEFIRGPATGSLYQCYWEPAAWIDGARAFVVIALIWGLAMLDMMRASSLSYATGVWYFHQADNYPAKPPMPALAGLKAAFRAWGTNAKAAAIITIVDIFQRVARNKCLRCSPVGWVLWACLYFFKTCIEFLSKFTVIIAAVSGLDFWDSAKKGYGMLKRHFVGGYVTNRVGFAVLEGGAFIFALLIGFIVWTSIATENGQDPFAGRVDVSLVLKIILWIFAILCLAYPLFGLIIIGLLANVFGSTLDWPFTFGLFAATFAHILLRFFAWVVLDITDAIFVFQAMDRDNGTMSPVGAEIFKALVQMPELASWKNAPGGNYQVLVNNPKTTV